MSILSEFQKAKRYIKTNTGYKLQSQWTSSETVEMADGNTLEHNLGNIRGITDSFDDDSTKALSSKAGKTLMDQLAALNGSLSGLVNIRYNIETDMVQLFNGSEWVDWKSAEQRNLICFPTNEHNVVFGTHPTSSGNISVNISIDNIEIFSSVPSGGASRACYLKSAKGSSVDLSLYSKLVIDATVTNTSSDSGQYAAVCWIKSLTTSSLNDYEILGKISGNVVGKEFDISNIVSGYLGVIVRKENTSSTLILNCTKFTLVKHNHLEFYRYAPDSLRVQNHQFRFKPQLF